MNLKKFPLTIIAYLICVADNFKAPERGFKRRDLCEHTQERLEA